MAEVNPPMAIEETSDQHARQWRLALGDALQLDSGVPGAGTGVCGPHISAAGGHLKVTEADAPGQKVKVAAGRAYVPCDSAADGGVYHVHNDAPVELDLVAAEGSARTDVIVARVRDDAEGDGTGDAAWALEVVKGTAGGGVPATPDNSLVLAHVSVPAGDNTVNNTQITDKRYHWTETLPENYYVGQWTLASATGVNPDDWRAMNMGVVHDPSGMDNGSTYVIQRAGVYDVDFSAASPDKLECRVRISRNGNRLAAGGDSYWLGGSRPVHVAWSGELQQGNIMRFEVFHVNNEGTWTNMAASIRYRGPMPSGNVG